jgi:hypothetical protein
MRKEDEMTKAERREALAKARAKRWEKIIEEPVTRITVYIYESQNDWLEQASKQSSPGMGRKLSKAEMIREAISDYQKKYFIV